MFTFYISLKRRHRQSTRQHMWLRQIAQVLFILYCMLWIKPMSHKPLLEITIELENSMSLCCSRQLFCWQWCVLNHLEPSRHISGLGYISCQTWWQNPEVVEQMMPFHVFFHCQIGYTFQTAGGEYEVCFIALPCTIGEGEKKPSTSGRKVLSQSLLLC